jgi:hypothetical protein
LSYEEAVAIILLGFCICCMLSSMLSLSYGSGIL